MTRAIGSALCLLWACAAQADLSFGISPSFDGTLYSEYPAGDAPQTGATCPSGYTCLNMGDALGDVDAVSATEWGFSCAGTNDIDNNCLAYDTLSSGDIQFEARLQGSWAGHTENFTFAGVFLREGVAGGEWFAQCSWPHIGGARYKVGTASSWASELGATGQFLPRYLALTHDDSANETKCFESGDGATWFQVGSATSRNISLPAQYGLFLTSHDVAQSTQVTFDNISVSTTIDITDSGTPPGPVGSDFLISSGTPDFNCNTEGVEPGDTVSIAGGTRGSLRIVNCFGTLANPITIRNDPTAGGPAIINGTGDRYLEINNIEHVTISGLGKWVGAPFGTCGITIVGFLFIESTDTCGIVIRSSGNDPTHMLRIGGTATKFIAEGIEIDGSNLGGNTIGFSLNDHQVKQADEPGEQWREDIIFRHNYGHDITGEAMYIGPNYGTANTDDVLRLRNIEIAFNLIRDVGSDGIELKSAIEGTNRIHHNRVENAGWTAIRTITNGNNARNISCYESSCVIDHNIVNTNEETDQPSNCIVHQSFRAPLSLSTLVSEIYNNVVWDCDNNSISVSRRTDSANVQATIYNNTAVDRQAGSGRCINVSSAALDSTLARDNVCADAGSIALGGGTSTNNWVGTLAQALFQDQANNDYRLTASSPARNAGTANAPSDDVVGVSRPQGSADDQGAYEYQE